MFAPSPPPCLSMKTCLHLPKVLLSRVALMAIVCLFIGSSAFAQFAGGSGTPADPYQIATAAQLDGIRNHLDAHFILTANIDLNGVRFLPICDDFSGSLDGNGFAISNWTHPGQGYPPPRFSICS